MTRHIVALANRVPYPLDDGWKVRAFHVTRALARLGELTLVALDGPGSDAVADLRRALPEVRVITVRGRRGYAPAQLARGVFGRWPVHVWNQRLHALRRVLDELAGHRPPPDLVVAYGALMAPIAAEHFPYSPWAIDTHNIDSLLLTRYAEVETRPWRRWYSRITARKFAALEAEIFPRCRAVWVCSAPEVRTVLARVPGASVHMLPNGIDTGYFAPMAFGRRERNRLVFFGRLDYWPNVDGLGFFLREILPLVRRQVPEATLSILGQGDPAQVRALAEGAPGVELAGRVPDIRPWLGRATAVVVPLRVGGGTRLKILEALAMAAPTVSTTIGAEGLDLRDSRDLLLADDAEPFAEATIQLLTHDELARRLGSGGRRTVEARYDWERTLAGAAASVGWEAPKPAGAD